MACNNKRRAPRDGTRQPKHKRPRTAKAASSMANATQAAANKSQFHAASSNSSVRREDTTSPDQCAQPTSSICLPNVMPEVPRTLPRPSNSDLLYSSRGFSGAEVPPSFDFQEMSQLNRRRGGRIATTSLPSTCHVSDTRIFQAEQTTPSTQRQVSSSGSKILQSTMPSPQERLNGTQQQRELPEMYSNQPNLDNNPSWLLNTPLVTPNSQGVVQKPISPQLYSAVDHEEASDVSGNENDHLQQKSLEYTFFDNSYFNQEDGSVEEMND